MSRREGRAHRSSRSPTHCSSARTGRAPAGAAVGVAPGPDAALRLPLQHQHDLVVRRVADQQPLVQAHRQRHDRGVTRVRAVAHAAAGDKIEAMRSAGIAVAESPASLGSTMLKVLR